MDAQTSVVRHVFGIDRDLSRRRAFGAERFDKVQIVAEGGVIAEVTVKA